jgi:hypothetical protein
VDVRSNGNCSAQSYGLTVQRQADLDLLNPCTSFYGWINIQINSTSITIPPGLTTITGALYVGSAQSIEADGLTEIRQYVAEAVNLGPSAYGGLYIGPQTSLSKLSFPKLIDVGDFILSNISNLQTIDGFPALSKVYGDFYMSGAFTNVLFPNLTYVGGGFTILSSDSNFQCSFMQQFFANGALGPGEVYECGYVNNPTAAIVPIVATPTGSPSSTHTSKSSATAAKYLGISSEK